jgi:manganese/zinc/iron transport system permease protein
MSLFFYFTDPVLKAPMIGSLAVAIISSLIGTILITRRQSLLGEVISHAAFPGIMLGVLIVAPFLQTAGIAFSAALLVLGFIFSMLGILSINYLERRKISSDLSLCIILACFFGFGVLIASRLQVLQTAWYKQALVFLYGQAATMTDRYLPLYVALTVATIGLVVLLYPKIQAFVFDPAFAKSVGIKTNKVDICIKILAALAVVLGMRSVGVILMAGMLIGPGIAARPWCRKLSSTLTLAVLFGIASAILGNLLSFEGTEWLTSKYPDLHFSLPTGPMILIVASSFCFVSLLFSPQGSVIRFIRRWQFKRKIISENLLKAFWKKGKGMAVSKRELYHSFPGSVLTLYYLKLRGWVELSGHNAYALSDHGWKKASRIVRLHRLWEGYLVHYMGQGVDRVHKSAEEFEHLSDALLEEELEKLLGNLEKDPHEKPIPKREEEGAAP